MAEREQLSQFLWALCKHGEGVLTLSQLDKIMEEAKKLYHISPEIEDGDTLAPGGCSQPANREIARVDFRDVYGESCSLQESSLTTDNCIWIGCSNHVPRMHLNQKMVAQLLPHLNRFVGTGSLREE
jgi:hypothetical protein